MNKPVKSLYNGVFEAVADEVDFDGDVEIVTGLRGAPPKRKGVHDFDEDLEDIASADAFNEDIVKAAMKNVEFDEESEVSACFICISSLLDLSALHKLTRASFVMYS